VTLTQPAPAKSKRQRRRKHSALPLVPERPDEASLGPCMRALTQKQRRFVLELRHGPAGYGSEVRAARAEGYGTRTSSDLALRVEAHRVLHNPNVQEALREIGGKIIRAEAFQSIKNTVAIANDLQHRDCLKANLALMDRGGFAVETHHSVTVEHKIDYTRQALEEIARFRALGVARDRLEQIYGPDGLYHLEQQLEHNKAIDGEATAAE
jgi:phage terminase small subunit